MVLNHHHHNTPYPIDNGLHNVMHDGVVIVVAAIQVLQRRVCAQSLQQMPATLPTKLSATTTAGDFFLGTHRLVVAGWIKQEQFVVGMSVKRKTKNVKRKTSNLKHPSHLNHTFITHSSNLHQTSIKPQTLMLLSQQRCTLYKHRRFHCRFHSSEHQRYMHVPDVQQQQRRVDGQCLAQIVHRGQRHVRVGNVERRQRGVGEGVEAGIKRQLHGGAMF